MLIRNVFDGTHQRGEKGVLNIGDNEANNSGASSPQAACNTVTLIIQLFYDLENLGAEFGTDVGVIVQHAGHRSDRNPCQFRHFLHGGH